MSNASSLKNLAVSETGFVFDPHSGATFTVNATGLVVLAGLRDGASIPEIAAALEARFDERPSDYREDIADFVSALTQHGLIPQGESR